MNIRPYPVIQYYFLTFASRMETFAFIKNIFHTFDVETPYLQVYPKDEFHDCVKLKHGLIRTSLE